eukprot:4639637-Karenia_brevis.AAC.1
MQSLVKKLTGKIVTLLFIQKESTLHMVLCQRRSIRTFAKVLSGIPPDQQCQILASNVDGCALSDLNFQNESTLQAVPRLRGGMQIFVKMLTGKSITLDVNASDTIDSV